MIILREREMKHDVSNNKRIKSFRVKRKEPSGKKETDQRVIKSHLQLIDERGDGDDIVWTTTTTTAIHFRAADAETSGGISLIGGGRAVSVISNLCFVLFFLSCVF